MTSVQEIYDGYLQVCAERRKNDERICDKERSIARLQKQIERLESKKYTGGWVKCLLEPLAELLMPLLGCDKYRILGPFGLRNETSLWFIKPNSTAQYCDYSLSFTVRCEYNDDDDYKGVYCSPSMKNVRLFYNTGRRTNIYPQGSIGELNGFDVIEAPLPDDVDEIIKILKEQEKSQK
ncbi:MAG: hypothetical protein IJY39_09575 [Clostridia bacterium]|nr:hypothetical protein [Clostridia bacterium]